MKIKSSLLIALCLLSLIPLGLSTQVALDDNHGVPAPVFESINETGVDDSYIYENNTEITITYNADRFAVDGLILLGSGSNLTEDISNTEYLRNFTLISSLRKNSVYTIELNITSYTYFYAMAYSGDMTNNTIEELDFFDDAPGHQLWIEEGKLYPTFDDDSTTIDIIEGEMYTPFGSTVEIFYEVRNSDDNEAGEFATISVAENDTGVFHEDQATIWQNMTKIENIEIGDFRFSRFSINVTITEPVMYFTAFNENGWERTDGRTEDLHKITTGFSISNEYFNTPYNTLDSFEFNITTINETAGVSIGYQYRVYENTTTDIASNWTIVDGLTNTTGELIDFEIDSVVYENSTLERVYVVEFFEQFNESNVVEIKQFAKYGVASNISTAPRLFTLEDPTPELTINNLNETFTNSDEKMISYSISTPKGEITSATLKHGLPTGDNNTEVSIQDTDNYNVTFSLDGEETILEGNHTIYFNVTNSYNVSLTKILIFQVDQTDPNATLVFRNLPTGSSTDGRITVDFNFEDTGTFISGIKFASLDFGNNITINATSLTSANMVYRTTGEYLIELIVYDKAGNNDTVELELQVTLPGSINNSTNSGSPINYIVVILSIFVIPIISSKRRRY